MYLGQLLKSVSKKYQKIDVKGISFDSREIKKKDIFFAIKGNQTSGIKFIKDIYHWLIEQEHDQNFQI